MECLICKSSTRKIFSKVLLNKHNADYFQCDECGFVRATPSETWLDEAYCSAITKTDLGLLSRNLYYTPKVEDLLLRHFDKTKSYLDYAGGYGTFTRLMRDRGFDFYHEDIYCENIFAYDFKADEKKQQSYELITAFEFMEHSPDPVNALRDIFSRTESFLFSTEVIPANNLENWWYLTTETGQHISLYSEASLRKLAEQFGMLFYTNHRNLHLFSSKILPDNVLTRKKYIFDSLFRKKLKSLLGSDYEMVKKRLGA